MRTVQQASLSGLTLCSLGQSSLGHCLLAQTTSSELASQVQVAQRLKPKGGM